jgi:hypothetical protein
MRWAPIAVLALMALINIGRGAVHAFAPDGGAHSIAGLDLSGNQATILSLFATLGLSQIVKGLFEGWVVVFRRDLAALFLLMQAADTALAMANLYLWRPFPVIVPGQPFNLALLALQLAALVLAWRASAPAQPPASRTTA